jgi:hypothetical protein
MAWGSIDGEPMNNTEKDSEHKMYVQAAIKHPCLCLYLLINPFPTHTYVTAIVDPLMLTEVNTSPFW